MDLWIHWDPPSCTKVRVTATLFTFKQQKHWNEKLFPVSTIKHSPQWIVSSFIVFFSNFSSSVHSLFAIFVCLLQPCMCFIYIWLWTTMNMFHIYLNHLQPRSNHTTTGKTKLNKKQYKSSESNIPKYLVCSLDHCSGCIILIFIV